jgi:hypothetical protein
VSRFNGSRDAPTPNGAGTPERTHIPDGTPAAGGPTPARDSLRRPLTSQATLAARSRTPRLVWAEKACENRGFLSPISLVDDTGYSVTKMTRAAGAHLLSGSWDGPP